ncbi:hypothetical protein ACNVED_02840 [Legionella sp. D16C41]|uniref:hypothetical protein n=1 Tax=Legionella sp. D16C41 TaxID=3402688 RepID=UPI003AF66615
MLGIANTLFGSNNRTDSEENNTSSEVVSPPTEIQFKVINNSAEPSVNLEELQKKSVMLPFSPDEMVQQYGATCKLTVIASVDRFFAHKNHYPAVPVFKNSKGVYGQEKSGVSIRQLSKYLGSIQGELLEIDQLTTLLNQSLGYESEVVELGSEEEFRARVIHELQQGQPCINFFSVDTRSEPEFHGKPIVTEKGDFEHACLITGYDALKDTLRITHWNRHFNVSLHQFYQSNQSLKDTRTQEHYRSIKEIMNILFGYQTKYSIQRKFNLADRDELIPLTKYLQKEMGTDPQLVLELAQTVPEIGTIIPKVGTGFRNKMICISAPTPNRVVEMQDSPLRLNTFI